MNVQEVIWKLYAIADSSIVDEQTRKAAKESANVLNNVRNLLGLGSGEELTAIISAVDELKAK